MTVRNYPNSRNGDPEFQGDLLVPQYRGVLVQREGLLEQGHTHTSEPPKVHHLLKRALWCEEEER